MIIPRERIIANKIIYSNNDRSDIIPANTTSYSYVKKYIED